MSDRTKLACRMGVLGLLLSAASVVTSVRADDLEDSAAPEAKPEAPKETAEAADSARANAASAASATSDATAAFGADAQGADPEVIAKARGHFEQGVEFY